MTDRLPEFIEHCPDAFVIVDAEGRIELFNGLAEQLFEFGRYEVIGQPVEVLIPERFHGGHVAHRSGYFAHAKNRPMGAGMELVGRRKDGTEFPVEISLSPLQTDFGPKAVSAVRDITERKQNEERLRTAKEAAETTLAELTAAKENLVHAEKMASLGQLTAGIAHEIKNPLNFVNNFAETSVELLDELGVAIAPALANPPVDAHADAGLAGQLLAQHGLYSDLIVVSQPENSRGGARPQSFPGELALSSGRPVIAIPYAGDHSGFGKRVLVAWNGSREASRALHDALPILTRAESAVVLAVDPPDEAHIPGADISAHLAHHGVRVEARRCVAPDIAVGDELLNMTSDLGSDLIVMGAYGRSRLREAVFGGATQHLLGQMTVPVLMSH